ncbi:LptF/LptG family permease, partial [uncultured Brevundimonas sp.]|uniref:LptF/LptG family permease n=1 Tax=uncultured Brevundimonas sp. TaxID=213418 RepID=UPI00263485F0
MRLARLERYVLGQQLKALGVALAIISALVMLIDFVEVSRGLNSDGELSALQILALIGAKSPSVIVQLLPFVFLFGTLGAYVSLNRRSELIAMRAAGISAWRFVLPAAACAFVLGIVTITTVGPLAAWGDSVWQSERARISGGGAPVAEASQPVWLREGDETRQMIIRGESQNRTTGQLLDATFFIYTITPEGQRRFTERVDAATATLTAGRWRLTGVVGGQGGQQAVRYDTLDLPSH